MESKPSGMSYINEEHDENEIEYIFLYTSESM